MRVGRRLAQCRGLQDGEVGEDGEDGRNRTAGECHPDPEPDPEWNEGEGERGGGRNPSGPISQPGPATPDSSFSIKRSFLRLPKRFSRFSRRMADNTSDVISK